MKKKIIIVILIALVVSGAVAVIFCTRHGGHKHGGEKGGELEVDYYTCPMHPFIHEKKPGECPICHMKLVPVYKGTSPPTPLLSKERGAEGGERSVSISTERQQLIGVKMGPVEKKHVVKEIRTVGRVAFDPDLAIAQREFLEIVRNVPSLKSAAVSRLRLLGMSPEEIRDLEKGAKQGVMNHAPTNLYLPQSGESLWVYAPIYEHEIPFVKIGDKAVMTILSETFEGTIRGIDPVVERVTRSVRARIEVPKAGGRVKPESYLTVRVQIDLGEQLTIPKTAVIDTGTRQLVFLVHEGSHFQAREVKLGAETLDDRVVLEGLTEGEIVATSAAFLIDSESQLKAAVAGMGGHEH